VVAFAGLLLSFAQPEISWHQMTHLPGSVWWVIIYLGVAATAFAFLTQLHEASPTRVGVILSTEPFFSAVFAVVLLGEHLGPYQLAGGGLVLGGPWCGTVGTLGRRSAS
jgi:drug/metabolite transporter (DMT)-like permease